MEKYVNGLNMKLVYYEDTVNIAIDNITTRIYSDSDTSYFEMYDRLSTGEKFVVSLDMDFGYTPLLYREQKVISLQPIKKFKLDVLNNTKSEDKEKCTKADIHLEFSFVEGIVESIEHRIYNIREEKHMIDVEEKTHIEEKHFDMQNIEGRYIVECKDVYIHSAYYVDYVAITHRTIIKE